VIEDEWLPEFEAEGLHAAAVYCGESPAFGTHIGRHTGMSFPMPWDIEFQVFDPYRIPGAVFPLRVVLDREGNVVYKATTEEPDPEDIDDEIECPDGAASCPCDGRGNLCLTYDAIAAAVAE